MNKVFGEILYGMSGYIEAPRRFAFKENRITEHMGYKRKPLINMREHVSAVVRR